MPPTKGLSWGKHLTSSFHRHLLNTYKEPSTSPLPALCLPEKAAPRRTATHRLKAALQEAQASLTCPSLTWKKAGPHPQDSGPLAGALGRAPEQALGWHHLIFTCSICQTWSTHNPFLPKEGWQSAFKEGERDQNLRTRGSRSHARGLSTCLAAPVLPPYFPHLLYPLAGLPASTPGRPRPPSPQP